MKRSLLVLALVLFLVAPVWGDGNIQFPTKLGNFKAKVGEVTYHEDGIVLIPRGEGVLFQVTLSPPSISSLEPQHIIFSFYDEARELPYCESDFTDETGLAQVAIVRLLDPRTDQVAIGGPIPHWKIKKPGKYILEIKYKGDKGHHLAPCSLGPITVIFE